MDKEGLGGAGIRLLEEKDCWLAWHHRATGKNEVLLQSGKNSAVYSSRVETQKAEETGLNPAGCIFASGKIELRERESVLSSKTYSRRDEKRILDVLGRGLLK